jgi:copper chaperone
MEYNKSSRKEKFMKVKYSLEGLSCGHCVKTVQGTLEKNGISGKASLDDKSLEFDSDGSEAQVLKIRNLLQEEGFTLKEQLQ